MGIDQKIPTIHVVDDDRVLLDSLDVLLGIEGYAVRKYASARIFLEASWQCANGCIVTDVHMAEMTGLELLAEIGHRRNSVPVIVMTGRADAQLKLAAMKLGAFDFLTKPFDADALMASIDAALRHGHFESPRAPAAFRAPC
jgi:two-component system response regulator FixJ